MAAKIDKSGKTKYALEGESIRARIGVPESIAQGETMAEDFTEAVIVMSEATDYAISKAMRYQWDQIKFERREAFSEDKKIVLSSKDLDRITNKAVDFLPDSIRSRAANFEGDKAQEGVFGDVYGLTMEIFNAYSPEGLKTRVTNRVPELLSTVCELPPEPEA